MPVPQKLLTDILHTASWAPTHRLKEPWQLRIYGYQSIGQLAEQMLASYIRMGYVKEGPEARQSVENIKTFVTSIPHHILIYFERHENQQIYEEDFAAVCAFIQNAQLAAWEHGVGMLWTMSPYLYDPEFLKSIGLPAEKYKVVAVLQTGYPEKVPERKERTDISSKIKWMDEDKE